MENRKTDMNETVLQQVYAIMEKHRSTKERKSYNIFEVLEVSEKEVIMCRMLADLLNPKGAHGQGDYYLKRFLRDVLKEADADIICKTANVYKEFPIAEERRIDIVITSAERFIPIEVKIHAGEQQAQCFHYYQYAKSRDKNPKVIYLTKWGAFPSAYSLSSMDGSSQLDYDHIQMISFSEDIVNWLSDLLEDLQRNLKRNLMKDSVKDSMEDVLELKDTLFLKELLSQYKYAIETFTQSDRGNMQMEIAQMLVQSEENFRGMLGVEQSSRKAKALLMYKVMEEIEHQMQPVAEKYGLKKEEHFSWYVYTEQANETFYKQSESTYPGLNYVIEDVKLPENVELWFRIEIDYALFAGICLFDPNAELEKGVYGNQLDNPSETIKEALSQYIHTENAQYEAWWVRWWYLPTGEADDRIGKGSIPNFKYMNEAAVRLSDEENRKCFAGEAVRMIERKLGELLKDRRG